MACVHRQMSAPTLGHVSLQEDLSYIFVYIFESSASEGCCSGTHEQQHHTPRGSATCFKCGQEGELTCTEVMEPLFVVVMRS